MKLPEKSKFYKIFTTKIWHSTVTFVNYQVANELEHIDYPALVTIIHW